MMKLWLTNFWIVCPNLRPNEITMKDLWTKFLCNTCHETWNLHKMSQHETLALECAQYWYEMLKPTPIYIGGPHITPPVPMLSTPHMCRGGTMSDVHPPPPCPSAPWCVGLVLAQIWFQFCRIVLREHISILTSSGSVWISWYRAIENLWNVLPRFFPSREMATSEPENLQQLHVSKLRQTASTDGPRLR